MAAGDSFLTGNPGRTDRRSYSVTWRTRTAGPTTPCEASGC